ncbi:MAG: BrnA antitoxin family protein [Bosea sp. (in: a-proteobacteria)]
MSFTLEELKARQSSTDWARVDATTEDELEQMDRDDPDLQGFENIDWSKAEWVIPQPKAAISIRLDADVLAFFKADGAGYQSRINAVLRSYMKATKKG